MVLVEKIYCRSIPKINISMTLFCRRPAQLWLAVSLRPKFVQANQQTKTFADRRKAVQEVQAAVWGFHQDGVRKWELLQLEMGIFKIAYFFIKLNRDFPCILMQIYAQLIQFEKFLFRCAEVSRKYFTKNMRSYVVNWFKSNQKLWNLKNSRFELKRLEKKFP